jgi:Ca2+-binding RTX toxin-like protein
VQSQESIHGGIIPHAFGNFFFGDDASDSIVGTAAADFIFGNGGNDTINGAAGSDVYAGEGRWSREDSERGDTIRLFDDGLDLIDLRGSGLQFSDLTIIPISDEGYFTAILSDRGQISFTDPVFIDESDLLFDPAPPLEFVL